MNRSCRGLILLALLIVGCNPPAQLQPNTADDPIPVTVTPLVVRSIERTVSLVGSLNAWEEKLIQPKVEGRIQVIRHEMGDLVRPNAVLAELEKVDFENALNEAQFAFRAEAAKLIRDDGKPIDEQQCTPEAYTIVRRAQDVLDNARRNRERAEELSRKNALAIQELERVQFEERIAERGLRLAIAEVTSAHAAMNRFRAAVMRAEQALRDTLITVPEPTPTSRVKLVEPIEFAVAERMATVGEMFRALQAGPIFRLSLDKDLKLQASIPQRYADEVKPGQVVRLRIDAFAEETFTGTVTRVSPVVDPKTRTFLIEVHLANPQRRIKPGTFAKGVIVTGSDPQARVVPPQAVVEFAGIAKIFLVVDGKAKAVQVTVGLRDPEWVEVRPVGKEPFPAAASVITSGLTQVTDGMAVRVR